MKIKDCFDDFTFCARVKPVLTVVFPCILICLVKGIFRIDRLEVGGLLTVTVVVITFGAYIIREFGKSLEERLFKELGAKPTTILLRFSDDNISLVTKTRYHNWINKTYQELQLPQNIKEEKEDENSDDKYSSAMDILRNIANSDREKYPRVYQELKKYNYWRNLRGCKIYALCLYMVVIVIQAINIQNFSLLDLVKFSSLEYTLIAGMLGWCIIFFIVVNKRTVMRNAYDYAKALLEIIEILGKEE